MAVGGLGMGRGWGGGSGRRRQGRVVAATWEGRSRLCRRRGRPATAGRVDGRSRPGHDLDGHNLPVTSDLRSRGGLAGGLSGRNGWRSFREEWLEVFHGGMAGGLSRRNGRRSFTEEWLEVFQGGMAGGLSRRNGWRSFREEWPAVFRVETAWVLCDCLHPARPKRRSAPARRKSSDCLTPSSLSSGSRRNGWRSSAARRKFEASQQVRGPRPAHIVVLNLRGCGNSRLGFCSGSPEVRVPRPPGARPKDGRGPAFLRPRPPQSTIERGALREGGGGVMQSLDRQRDTP